MVFIGPDALPDVQPVHSTGNWVFFIMTPSLGRLPAKVQWLYLPWFYIRVPSPRWIAFTTATELHLPQYILLYLIIYYSYIYCYPYILHVIKIYVIHKSVRAYMHL